MTSIDPSHQLAALLRKQVSAVRDGGAKAGPAGSPAPAERAQADAASVAGGRIQALSPNDPDRKKKALRIFLESVLLQELGAELVHDPSFSDMVDAVQGQMQADSEMAAAADELSELLVAGATRK